MVDDSWITPKEAQTRLSAAGCATNISKGRIHFERGSIRGSYHIHAKGIDEVAFKRTEAKLFEEG